MVQSAGYMRRAGAGRYGGKEKLRRQTEEAAKRMNEEVRRTGKARSKKEKLRNGPDTGKRKANRNLGRMRRDGCRRGHARHGEWSRRDASDIDGQAERPKGAGASKSIRPLADLMLEVSAFASATARQVMFDVNFGFRNQEARKAGGKAAGAAIGSVIGRESNALENVDDQI